SLNFECLSSGKAKSLNLLPFWQSQISSLRVLRREVVNEPLETIANCPSFEKVAKLSDLPVCVRQISLPLSRSQRSNKPFERAVNTFFPFGVKRIAIISLLSEPGENW